MDNKKVKELSNANLGCTSPEEFVDALDAIHRSKGYDVIRNNMTQAMMVSIHANTDLYQKFQEIKAECKKSYDYDRKTATTLEVNRGLTGLYGLVVNLIKAQKSDVDDTLVKVCGAINRIEEKVGLEPTDWTGGTSDATDHTSNGEGITQCGE